MGSAADTAHCKKIASALSALGIESEMRIASAHKVPARLLDLLHSYEEDPRPKIYVAVAGRSNALSGMLDCAVAAPVVSCPPYSDAFGGADLFSSIRMPSGVVPALILDPAGTAMFAAKVFGLTDATIRSAVSRAQSANRDRLRADDTKLVTEAYMPQIAAAREAADCILAATDAPTVFGSAAGSVTARLEGKVRDRYEFSAGGGSQRLALVTTDRQSAFDRVLAQVPYKGAVLNLVSAWWFARTQHIVPNHVVSVPHPNVTVALKCTPFPVEFVVRGFITGSTDTSLWHNYNTLGKREYCGLRFPDGLRKNQRLDAAVLTPTTKADAGDKPISVAEIVSEGHMTQADCDACAKAAMALFEYGQRTAASNGLILVDTKYEFGKDADGTIRLIDEIHTPDSSRYWLAASYDARFAKREEPENVDKEFLRLWFRDNSEPYDKSKPLPDAPNDLVDELSRRYIMLYELITGEVFDFSAAEAGVAAIPAAMQTAVSGANANVRV